MPQFHLFFSILIAKYLRIISRPLVKRFIVLWGCKIDAITSTKIAMSWCNTKFERYYRVSGSTVYICISTFTTVTFPNWQQVTRILVKNLKRICDERRWLSPEKYFYIEKNFFSSHHFCYYRINFWLSPNDVGISTRIKVTATFIAVGLGIVDFYTPDCMPHDFFFFILFFSARMIHLAVSTSLFVRVVVFPSFQPIPMKSGDDFFCYRVASTARRITDITPSEWQSVLVLFHPRFISDSLSRFCILVFDPGQPLRPTPSPQELGLGEKVRGPSIALSMLCRVGYLLFIAGLHQARISDALFMH